MMGAFIVFASIVLAIGTPLFIALINDGSYEGEREQIMQENSYVYASPEDAMQMRKADVPVFCDVIHTDFYYFNRPRNESVYYFGFYDSEKVYFNWSRIESNRFAELLAEDKEQKAKLAYSENESREAYEYLIGKLTRYEQEQAKKAAERLSEAKETFEEVNKHEMS